MDDERDGRFPRWVYGAGTEPDARFSLASVEDSMNPLLRGNFYGLQLWGSYLLSPAARLSAVFEENVNPFTRSDTKVFLLFDLRADL